MENLIYEFGYLTLPQKLVLIFWGICVVAFYSTLIYLIVSIVKQKIKDIHGKVRSHVG
jgi:hypothetical protein